MKSYPTYEVLAIDLDLHFFDKVKILNRVGKGIENRSWFVVTDDGKCHLFDKDGNLDDISKLHILKEKYVRKDVKKIIIPDSVTSIGDWTFNCCYRLIDVAIPNSVKSIGVYTFLGCSGLKSVLIGNGVTSIAGYTFWHCKNLRSLFFKGKTLKQVKSMKNYPWGIEDESIIKGYILS